MLKIWIHEHWVNTVSISGIKIMRSALFAATLAIAASFAAPASAAVVFTDNFDTENGGNSQINYIAFANFTSTGTNFVDIVKSGDFFITCSGSCVDLDGSPGPGGLTSIASFAFNAGDFVRLSFDMGGSQRSTDNDPFDAGFNFSSSVDMINYGFNFFGTDVIAFPGISSTTAVTSGNGIFGGDPFSNRSIFFTAGNAGSLRFVFSSDSADNIGPLLDNVSLAVTASVPESSTWGMMIAGFGIAGATLRRRRTVRAMPAAA
jgi:hypothetical protein